MVEGVANAAKFTPGTLEAELERMHARQASDLHLVPGRPPVLRVDGDLVPLADAPVLSGAKVAEYTRRALKLAGRDHEQLLEDADFAFAVDGLGRFRVNAYEDALGPNVAVRAIPTEPPSLEKIGAPPLLTYLAELPRGLVLVTGPAGSGKSTTLAAMIGHINARLPKHVMTVEDPIEFMHPQGRALIHQREIGTHISTFDAALRSVLRADPDVILVGEMRDLETIQHALTAAETGHLVLATLHTSNAVGAIDRIVDAFPGGEKALVRTMLASALQAVIAQRLLPALGGGRVAAFELLVATPAVRNLIRENKLAQVESLIQLGAKHGMQSLKDAVLTLHATGQISPDAAERVLSDLRTRDGEDAPIGGRGAPMGGATAGFDSRGGRVLS